MSEPILILGLDISTTCTGVCILSKEENKEPQLVYCNYIDTDKSKADNLIDKAIIIKDFLYNLREQYPDINKIIIEDKLNQFSSGKDGKGKTNAMSMNKLIAFNGIISFVLYIIFKQYPESIHPSSARSKAWGTIPQTVKDKKLYCMEKVLKMFPQFKEHIHYSKDKKTGQLKIKDKPTYDISDSITIGLAGLKL